MPPWRGHGHKQHNQRLFICKHRTGRPHATPVKTSLDSWGNKYVCDPMEKANARFLERATPQCQRIISELHEVSTLCTATSSCPFDEVKNQVGLDHQGGNSEGIRNSDMRVSEIYPHKGQSNRAIQEVCARVPCG